MKISTDTQIIFNWTSRNYLVSVFLKNLFNSTFKVIRRNFSRGCIFFMSKNIYVRE